MSTLPGPDGDLREHVRAAQAGDAGALEKTVLAVRDDVYRLALRMLAHPEDAEDACQEILVKVITRLGEFRGEAAPRTWVYRIAVNHLLDRRKSRVESLSLDFDGFAADLMDGLTTSDGDPALAEEVRRGCTLAMLTCLDREHRLAFLLVDVLDLGYEQAASACDIGEPALRQRVSRARRALQEFTERWCGIVNSRAPCRCSKRVARALELGRIDAATRREADAGLAQMTDLHDTAALMRANPDHRAPERIAEIVRALLAGGAPLS